MKVNTCYIGLYRLLCISGNLCLFAIILLLGSCKNTVDLSSDNIIQDFSIQSFNGIITSNNDSIHVIVPSGTKLIDIPATFSVYNKSDVKVADVAQVSGKTLNDFSKPLMYVVTAEDGSQRKYIITVSLGNITLLNLDFDGPDFALYGSFDFTDNGYKKTGYDYNGTIWYVPTIKIEGSSSSNTPRVTVVNSQLPNSGNALQYTLGSQLPTDLKARAEHYLVIEDFKKTYVSEFSLKLHPDFTPIDLVRIDGGPSWCCLRQWHQSSPESPPMALELKKGTNNVVTTNFLSGTYKAGSGNKSYRTSEKTLQLGRWYHFRYEWRIDPGTDNSYCKIWVSDSRKGAQMNDSDIWCDYKGRIGFTLVGKPASEMEPLSRNIREQQGLYQSTHVNVNSFHAVTYDNVKITQIK
jgi:hypothetical protein